MLEVVPLVNEVAIAVGAAPCPVVDCLGRGQGDAGVFVAGVVRARVVVEVGAGVVVEDLENYGVVRAVFHRAELGLGVRVVVDNIGPFVTFGDVVRREELGQGVGAHGGAEVGVVQLGDFAVTERTPEHLDGKVVALAFLDSETNDRVGWIDFRARVSADRRYPTTTLSWAL